MKIIIWQIDDQVLKFKMYCLYLLCCQECVISLYAITSTQNDVQQDDQCLKLITSLLIIIAFEIKSCLFNIVPVCR